MKLAVVNDWFSDKMNQWNKDGFLKCLDIFQREYGWEVIFFKKSEPGIFKHPYVYFHYVDDVKKAVLDYKPDAILGFSDLSRPYLGELKGSGIPIALAFSGGPYDDYEEVPDIIFVESQVYYDRFKARGRNVVKAFGTNTEIFKPIPEQPKIFDACYPATMATWKRHYLFAEALGSRGLVCGWWQPHEPHCWQVCQKYGTALLHHQNAESVNLIYNMSRTCVITADSTGGCQRTVLESMACNVPVIVTVDSDKTTEFVRACGVGEIVYPEPEAIRQAVEKWKNQKVSTREWILNNYSEKIYASKLKEGIMSICH